MEEPTNRELAQMISGLREIVELRFKVTDGKFDQDFKEHIKMNEHLAKLNGQVAQNTKWRESWKTILAAVAVIAGFIVPLAQHYILTYII